VYLCSGDRGYIQVNKQAPLNEGEAGGRADRSSVPQFARIVITETGDCGDLSGDGSEIVEVDSQWGESSGDQVWTGRMTVKNNRPVKMEIEATVDTGSDEFSDQAIVGASSEETFTWSRSFPTWPDEFCRVSFTMDELASGGVSESREDVVAKDFESGPTGGAGASGLAPPCSNLPAESAAIYNVHVGVGGVLNDNAAFSVDVAIVAFGSLCDDFRQFGRVAREDGG
jgi:hypothetical protein